jgi:hypothetical protein
MIQEKQMHQVVMATRERGLKFMYLESKRTL